MNSFLEKFQKDVKQNKYNLKKGGIYFGKIKEYTEALLREFKEEEKNALDDNVQYTSETGPDNWIHFKDLQAGQTYYLTGEYWDFGDNLVNTPVKLNYFLNTSQERLKEGQRNMSALVLREDGREVIVSSYLFINPIKI